MTKLIFAILLQGNSYERNSARRKFGYNNKKERKKSCLKIAEPVSNTLPLHYKGFALSAVKLELCNKHLPIQIT
jgi:hypothetical protein